MPGAISAIAGMSRAGIGLAVVTNQACVGRGEVPMAVVEACHRRLSDLVAEAGGRIDQVLVATSSDDKHPDRKPNPGLVTRACSLLGCAPAEAWMVGDDARDILAARAGGARPALVLTGKGMATRTRHPEVPCFADLAAFADALLAGRLP